VAAAQEAAVLKRIRWTKIGNHTHAAKITEKVPELNL
jgi:hypothetical protein